MGGVRFFKDKVKKIIRGTT